MPQSFGIIHVFIPSEPAENGLAKHADQRVTTVLARACIGKTIACRTTQAQCVIEFAIREETRIRGDDGTAKVNHHTPVEIQPEKIILHFTRRVRQCGLNSSA